MLLRRRGLTSGERVQLLGQEGGLLTGRADLAQKFLGVPGVGRQELLAAAADDAEEVVEIVSDIAGKLSQIAGVERGCGGGHGFVGPAQSSLE